MNLQVDIQSATVEAVPDEDDIRSWVTAALSGRCKGDTEISLRLVDTDEMARLNERYRRKHGPTNVLSFPTELPDGVVIPLLGDIVICAPVVRAEAAEQGKTLPAHWAHMTVHGTLHLLGYDHIEESDASTMEALESTIMAALNFPCPYRGDAIKEHARA